MANRTMPISRKDFEMLRRIHVLEGVDWATSAGTDFWLMANSTTTPWAAGQGTLASERGWTVTSIAAITSGAGADFLSLADKGTPGEFTQNGAADLIESPAMFGDWTHGHMAAEILGHRVMPRFLVADFMARFSVTSADEATTAIGFVEDGGSIVTSADHIAAVTVGATYFSLDVNATVTATAVALDQSSHLFRIVLDKSLSTATLYIDNVLGCVSTAAITADEFPASFGAGSGTTDRPQLQQAHIWYSWYNPGAGIAY